MGHSYGGNGKIYKFSVFLRGDFVILQLKLSHFSPIELLVFTWMTINSIHFHHIKLIEALNLFLITHRSIQDKFLTFCLLRGSFSRFCSWNYANFHSWGFKFLPGWLKKHLIFIIPNLSKDLSYFQSHLRG